MKTIPKTEINKDKQRSPDLLERSMLMLAGVIKPNIKSYCMTNKNEWIKTSERLPATDRYVWVAGEMKYNYQKDIARFVDIGWLNQDNEKEEYSHPYGIRRNPLRFHNGVGTFNTFTSYV